MALRRPCPAALALALAAAVGGGAAASELWPEGVRHPRPESLTTSGLDTRGALSPEQLARALADAGAGQVVHRQAGAGDALSDTGGGSGGGGGQSAASRNLVSGAVSEAAAAPPVVMMHGMGDFAANPMGMVPLRKMIEKEANTYVRSVEVCSAPERLENCAAEDQVNGFFMTMDDQVDQFARVVRADPKLAQGFNAVGFSQGSVIIRGYVHRYNSPPVKSFVSMHGVMMGVAGLPQCPLHIRGVRMICKAMDSLASLGIYTPLVQNRLAQANYYRDPKRIATFQKEGHFLPYINNEVPGRKNETFADNFKALERLVLVMAEDDTMVHPKESELFGYFADGSMSNMVDMRSAPWYVDDWFGLKALDEAEKIYQYTTPGNHLQFTDDFLMEMVKKYFVPGGEVTAQVFE